MLARDLLVVFAHIAEVRCIVERVRAVLVRFAKCCVIGVVHVAGLVMACAVIAVRGFMNVMRVRRAVLGDYLLDLVVPARFVSAA